MQLSDLIEKIFESEVVARAAPGIVVLAVREAYHALVPRPTGLVKL